MKLPARQTVFLYFSAISVNLLSFAVAVAFSWTSLAIPKLDGSMDNTDSPLDEPITEYQASLIASLFMLGAMLGPLLTSPLSYYLGYRRAIIILWFPIMLCFLMTAFATDLGVIYGARIFGGFASSSMYLVVPMFVTEISDKQNRGRLVCFMGVMSGFGNLYAYIAGNNFSLKWFALSGLVPPCILVIIMVLFIKDTPYYCIAQNNDTVQALKMLKKIRIQNEAELLGEIVEIRKTIEANESDRGRVRDIFQSRALKRSLIIILIATFIQVFIGTMPIMSFLQSILADSSGSLPADLSAIFIAIFKLFGNCISIFTIDRFGRRILLITSAAGNAISLLSLAIYFFLKDADISVTNLQWIPITALVCLTTFNEIGVFSVPYIQLGEFFPQKLKDIAATIVLTFEALLTFMVVFIFPYMKSYLGYGTTFCIFAVFATCHVLFTYFIIPETKGKSLLDIQIMLNQ